MLAAALPCCADECFAEETKGAAVPASISAARNYCEGLFPGQDPFGR